MKAILINKNTYVYLGLSVIAMILAMIITISDNPPGIILGFLSGIFFIMAFTHTLKKSKSYLLLTLGAIVSFIIFVILHNFLDYFGKGTFIEAIGAFFFLAAFFLCIPGLIIGIVGSIIKAIKK